MMREQKELKPILFYIQTHAHHRSARVVSYEIANTDSNTTVRLYICSFSFCISLTLSLRLSITHTRAFLFAIQTEKC